MLPLETAVLIPDPASGWDPPYGNRLVGVDCTAFPQAWPIEYIGLSVDGSGCGGGPLREGPIAVKPRSWAGIKSLYR